MSIKKGPLSALAAVILGLSACGGGTDATPPKYPYPQPVSVEDSELSEYLEDDEDALDADDAE